MPVTPLHGGVTGTMTHSGLGGELPHQGGEPTDRLGRRSSYCCSLLCLAGAVLGAPVERKRGCTHDNCRTDTDCHLLAFFAHGIASLDLFGYIVLYYIYVYIAISC